MQVDADLSDHTAHPTCHPSQTTEHPDVLTNLSNRGMATMIGDFNIIVGKSQTEGGIHTLLELCQIMLIMIPPL